MKKKDNKEKKPKLSKKELKEQAKKVEAERIAKVDAKTKAKAKANKPSKKGKPSQDWDEDDSKGGGDFFKVKTGKHLCRVRSIISVGQCQFTFNGKKDTKATSGIAVVAEVWPYKVDKKKGKIKLLSKEPAIVQGVLKALKGNAQSNYTKMMKTLGIKKVQELANMPCGIDVFTSDKGYMYLRSFHDIGMAEAKVIPELTKEGHLIPNLNCMTMEAMLELNPITQVKDYVLKATNYPGTEAEVIVDKIRKDKPEYARLKEQKDDEGKKPKKKKKGKKKLDPNKTY